jgi:hypothetical protein
MSRKTRAGRVTAELERDGCGGCEVDCANAVGVRVVLLTRFDLPLLV